MVSTGPVDDPRELGPQERMTTFPDRRSWPRGPSLQVDKILTSSILGPFAWLSMTRIPKAQFFFYLSLFFFSSPLDDLAGVIDIGGNRCRRDDVKLLAASFVKFCSICLRNSARKVSTDGCNFSPLATCLSFHAFVGLLSGMTPLEVPRRFQEPNGSGNRDKSRVEIDDRIGLTIRDPFFPADSVNTELYPRVSVANCVAAE